MEYDIGGNIIGLNRDNAFVKFSAIKPPSSVSQLLV